MKQIKPFILIAIIVVLITNCKEQQKEAGLDTEEASEITDLSKEKDAVVFVMKSYKDAIQNLTTDGTFELFTQDATVFEQGKVEGTYKDYIDHHLGPELGHFKSFTFSDYNIDITVNLPYAFATENYLYTIVLKGDDENGTKEQTIESKGVATSILKKNMNGEFKIIHTHCSFKKLKQ